MPDLDALQAAIDAAQQELDDAIEANDNPTLRAVLLGRVATARRRLEFAEKIAHASTSGPRR